MPTPVGAGWGRKARNYTDRPPRGK